MAKFTGFMCDVCQTAETGKDRHVYWLRLYLPVAGNGSDNERDLCSDKCLLKFARERAGVGTRQATKPKDKVPGLSEFLDTRGIKPSAKGAISAAHARRRHEMNGGVEDCLVCEFLTIREVNV
jgi:hypothetical protein